MWQSLLEFFQFPFIEATITGIAIGLFAIVRHRLRLRSLRGVWVHVFGSSPAKVRIVLPGFAVSEFEVRGGVSQIPDNVLVLPYAEALAINALRETFRNIYPGAEIVMQESSSFSDWTEPYVSVGGPSVNRVTDMLLNTYHMAPGMTISYPDHIGQDELVGEVYSVDYRDGAIVDDYGFIIVGANPLDRNSGVALLFGVWAHGTNAAAQSVSTHKPTVKEINQIFRTLYGEAVIVVHSRVAGIVTGGPTIESYRRLSNE